MKNIEYRPAAAVPARRWVERVKNRQKSGFSQCTDNQPAAFQQIVLAGPLLSFRLAITIQTARDKARFVRRLLRFGEAIGPLSRCLTAESRQKHSPEGCPSAPQCLGGKIPEKLMFVNLSDKKARPPHGVRAHYSLKYVIFCLISAVRDCSK